jgi:hypothetical protein
MRTPEIKELTHATFELGRKSVQSFTEFGIRAFNDYVDYTETVAKANATMFGNNTQAGLSDAYSKIQNEMLKGYSFWTDYLKNHTK